MYDLEDGRSNRRSAGLSPEPVRCQERAAGPWGFLSSVGVRNSIADRKAESGFVLGNNATTLFCLTITL